MQPLSEAHNRAQPRYSRRLPLGQPCCRRCSQLEGEASDEATLTCPDPSCMGAMKKVPVYAAFMVIDVCEKCGGEFFHAGELAAKIKLIEAGFRKKRKVMMALSALAGAGVGFGVSRLTGRNKRYEGDDSPEREKLSDGAKKLARNFLGS